MSHNTISDSIKAFRQLDLGIYTDFLNNDPFFSEFQNWQCNRKNFAPKHPLFKSWQAYSRADYATAANIAAEVSADVENAFVIGYAELALAKTCSDCGYFDKARSYASNALNIAKDNEFMELMAAASGALGEIHLRGGHPLTALEMFELDENLLCLGSKWKGRVLCYKAHAYSRLNCDLAARMAYRDAEYRPGEASRLYVLAGLAIHAQISGSPEPGWLTSALNKIESCHAQAGVYPNIPIAWLYWAKAYFSPDEAPKYLKQSYKAFGNHAILEKSYIRAWAKVSGIGLPSSDKPDLSRFQLPQNIITQTSGELDHLSFALAGDKLSNDGFSQIKWQNTQDGLLTQRSLFMP